MRAPKGARAVRWVKSQAYERGGTSRPHRSTALALGEVAALCGTLRRLGRARRSARQSRASPGCAIGGPHEAAGIAAVYLAARRSAYRHIVAPELLAQMTAASVQPWWEERLSSAPQPHRLLIGRAEQRRRSVLGFAHVGPGLCGVGELVRHYRSPQAQGVGLGRQLLAAAVAALREFGHRRGLLRTRPTGRTRRPLVVTRPSAARGLPERPPRCGLPRGLPALGDRPDD
jgi:ribosomal protein S18 acetylase RimI-like enzyme